MKEQAQQDVVIVGAGIAGLVAANRAAQLGLSATVLEQGKEEKYLCNSRYTGGTLHVAMRDIMLDEDVLRRQISEDSADFVTPELAALMAREGRRLVKWLQEEGLRFLRASGSEHHRWVLAPPGRSRPGLDWEGRAGDVMLRTLEKRLTDRGGRLVRGARGRRLLIAEGRCKGVVAEQGGEEVAYPARAVFIADGGFQGNPELVGRYITRHPESFKQRSAGTGRGDGLQMAAEAGAELIGMDRFYGHNLSIDALTNDMLWPYPYLDALVTAGIVVDAAGRRFVDEGRGGVYVANAIAKLEDTQSALVVFDQAIWDKPGRNGLIAPNPHLEQQGATMHKADTLEQLAALAGLPAEALARTVADYNRGLAGDPGALLPPRRVAKYAAFPVRQPPFYAMPMCVGITNTMGGIRINVHAQALRADGSAIAGLYALGAAAGGMEGGPEVAYVGGLSRGGVTGLMAAEHLAGEAR